MIHDRTAASISFGTIGGYFVGFGVGGTGTTLPWMVGGLLLAVAIGGLAIWYTPSPKEIAITWREHKRMTDDTEETANHD